MNFDHFTIRLLTTDDLVPYFEMVERNRKRLEDFFTGTVSRTQSLEAARGFLADITERAQNRTYFPYQIVDDRNGRLAGFLDLKNIFAVAGVSHPEHICKYLICLYNIGKV